MMAGHDNENSVMVQEQQPATADHPPEATVYYLSSKRLKIPQLVIRWIAGH